MALVKSTQLAITGPGLALRGPEGSMTRAISVMRIEYRKIGQLFYMGLVCTLISSALFCFADFSTSVAVLMSVLIAVFTAKLYVDLRQISNSLQYESVTGEKVRGLEHKLLPIAALNPGACFGAAKVSRTAEPHAVKKPLLVWHKCPPPPPPYARKQIECRLLRASATRHATPDTLT